jgi:hypothetical protein
LMKEIEKPLGTLIPQNRVPKSYNPYSDWCFNLDLLHVATNFFLESENLVTRALLFFYLAKEFTNSLVK